MLDEVIDWIAVLLPWRVSLAIFVAFLVLAEFDGALGNMALGCAPPRSAKN